MTPDNSPKTLYQRIWDSHVVREEPGQPSIIYIDRHLVHEGTSPQAFAGLRAEGRKGEGQLSATLQKAGFDLGRRRGVSKNADVDRHLLNCYFAIVP